METWPRQTGKTRMTQAKFIDDMNIKRGFSLEERKEYLRLLFSDKE